jgi:hypothetical protein
MPHNNVTGEKELKYRDNFLEQQKDIRAREDSLLINDQSWLNIHPNSHFKMDRLEDDNICDTFFWDQFKEADWYDGDNSGMNIGIMPWENILWIWKHHRKLLLHVASRPMKETQFLVPTLVREKMVLVEKMWERLRRGYRVGDEKFKTGAVGAGLKSSLAEWMEEGLVWDPVEGSEAMERAVKGASWYVCILSFSLAASISEHWVDEEKSGTMRCNTLSKTLHLGGRMQHA